MFIASDPRQYLGKIVDSGQCVRFVQVATPGLPHTGYWRAGQKVRGGAVPAGAVIATFEPDGRYTNRVDGGSHAAVLIAENSDGLAVYDQWVGQPVHQRVIRYRGGSGNAANDGDRFHVVEAEA